MSALLFGSMSTIVDTSERQRGAFNEAFARHDVAWNWERDPYRAMLDGNGGQQRIERYAAARGENVDAKALHETKSQLFRESLSAVPLQARPGVLATIRAARERGWRIGLVTTTSQMNVDALLEALGDQLDDTLFDVVTHNGTVSTPKPDPAAYELALSELDEKAETSIAIEDNPGGIRSARAAGVPCVVFANENTGGLDFGDVPRVAHLDLDDLIATLGVPQQS